MTGLIMRRSPISALRRRAGWRLLLMLAALLGIAVGISGVARPIERSFQGLAWSVGSKPASGQIQVVEIDAYSISRISKWPWPRSEHAQVVERLTKAGVRSIIFDVDFSSRSTIQEDNAFASAISRAGGRVVLPTFGQAAGGNYHQQIDALPAPQLRKHASLASVSVLPDTDGVVRRMPLGTMTAGLPRPSISALMAGQAGSADRDFPIDYAFDVRSVPRHSFADIRDGRFRQSDLAGKDVLIGATAIELGDRYVVPVFGVIPGVYIHALGIETLRAGAPLEMGWVPAFLVGTLLASILLANRHSARFHILAQLGVLTVPALGLTAHLLGMSVEIVPGIVIVLAAAVSGVTMRYVDAAAFRRNHDQNSGLPNKHALSNRLSHEEAAGVIAARIVEFDKLVVGLGQDGTAELIRRLRDRIELTAGPGTVHRIEDRVLCWTVASLQDMEDRIATLRTVMLNPVEVNGRPVDVMLAFGLAKPDGQELPDRVIANAAFSANRALDEGTAWHVHERRDEDLVDRDLSLLGELDAAISRNAIDVVFQPKIRLATDEICGVEALVRWNHPVRGMIRPDEFIQLAERNDRIAGLTLHVLQKTIEAIKTWHGEGHRISGAINISAKLLGSSNFMTDLIELVSSSGIEPHFLTFEVTETAAMSSCSAASTALQRFRDMGISVSIDDYGTGQSTLSYLKTLPINELKIDQSFVRHVHENGSDAILVRSTVELAHALGLQVVAEGVETLECASFLASIGTDVAQGYLFSRPVPLAEVSALLASTQPLAA